MMILREGKTGGIIMMMKVIIVAIYLHRADVVPQSRPLCITLTVTNYLSPLTHAHASRSPTPTLFTVHLLARCHSTTFVRAISGSSRR